MSGVKYGPAERPPPWEDEDSAARISLASAKSLLRRTKARFQGVLRVAMTGDLLEDENESQCLDLPVEDGPMHERWSEVLARRKADALAESELRWLIDTGTPLRYRHELWPRWWARRDGFAKAGIDKLQAQTSEELTLEIERDVKRTLPRCMKEEDRGTMQRALRAYAAMRPDTGYVQGMTFVAAVPLLLGFDEPAALACLSFLCEDVCPGYHSPGLDGYFRDVAVLGALANFLLPHVHELLEQLEMPLHLLATEHLLTLAARTWPFSAIVRLWDVVLMEGSPALLGSFLATLDMYLAEAVKCAEVDERGDSAEEVHGVVAVRFRELTRLNVCRDIDEVIFRTRKFVPLVRGEPAIGGARGEGTFLNWFREEVGETR